MSKVLISGFKEYPKPKHYLYDLKERDPRNMNNYIQVEFDDAIAEPKGTYSNDCVWKNSYKCFTCGKNNAYKILTFFCGICAGKT